MKDNKKSIILSIKQYLLNIMYAIMNKRIVAGKEQVVTQPLTKAQLKHLEDLFKLPVYKEGMSLTELANATGKYEVVEFIKAWSARGGKL